MAFLDPKALSQLETMAVKARAVVEGALSGLHRSPQHGSSVEFAEHKEYAPGDEIRHIDWKVFAKADRYYVKRYEQESELNAHLVIDSSGSMAYQGDGISKLEYASYLVASLAYLIIQQRDKVGLHVFGDPNIENYVPPRARPSHLQDLLTVLEGVHTRGAQGDESLAMSLDHIAELARKKKSMIVVVSDMFDTAGDPIAVLKRLRARGHDVVVFHVLDDHELKLPFEGLTVFESLEKESKLLANPGSIRKHYQRKLKAFLENAELGCRNGGIEYHLLSTSSPVEEALLAFLSLRLRGRR